MSQEVHEVDDSVPQHMVPDTETFDPAAEVDESGTPARLLPQRPGGGAGGGLLRDSLLVASPSKRVGSQGGVNVPNHLPSVSLYEHTGNEGLFGGGNNNTLLPSGVVVAAEAGEEDLEGGGLAEVDARVASLGLPYEAPPLISAEGEGIEDTDAGPVLATNNREQYVEDTFDDDEAEAGDADDEVAEGADAHDVDAEEDEDIEAGEDDGVVHIGSDDDDEADAQPSAAAPSGPPFALSRVKKLAKCTSSARLMNAEAISLLGDASAMILQDLVKEAVKLTLKRKKKTLTYDVMAEVIRSHDRFSYLNPIVPQLTTAAPFLSSGGGRKKAAAGTAAAPVVVGDDAE